MSTLRPGQLRQMTWQYSYTATPLKLGDIYLVLGLHHESTDSQEDLYWKVLIIDSSQEEVWLERTILQDILICEPNEV